MSERPGSRGKPRTRPHHPSGLRNEVRVESTDDESANHGSRIEVPGGDIVIPDMQLENFRDDDDLGHGDGGSYHPMSPGSRALISRNRISRSRKGPDALLEVKFLSRPDQLSRHGDSPPPFFLFKPAPKASSMPTRKEEAVSSQEASAPLAAATALDPAAQAPTEGGVTYENQPVLPEIHHVQSSVQPEQEPPTLTLPPLDDEHEFVQTAFQTAEDDILDVTPHPVAKDPHSPAGSNHVEAPPEGPVEAPRPRTRPRFPPAPKGQSGKKGRKGRKHKAAQHRDAPWPPKPRYADGNEAFQGLQGLEPPVHHAFPIASDEHAPVGQVESGYADEPARHRPFVQAQADDTNHHEQLVDDRLDNGNIVSHKLNQGVAPAAQLSHRQVEAVVPVVGEHGDAATPYEEPTEHPLQSPSARENIPQMRLPVEQEGPHHVGPSGRSHQAISDEVLHRTAPFGATDRVDKPGRKLRVGSHPRFPPPMSGIPGFSKLTPENENLVKLFVMSLGAAENKARDTVDACTKANETTIASLQATIGYQDKVIEGHKAENGRLQGSAQTLQGRCATLEKFVKGLEKDYDKLKGAAKYHQASCKEILKEKIAEIEGEKSALMEHITATLDAFDKSRRSMKSVLDDCYARLRISESKIVDLREQLLRQNRLYEEEKKRRSDLEQQVMPALQCLQEHVEKSHNALSGTLGTIQLSVDDNSADTERDARLKQCLDALHTLQATPFLTAKDLQKAEGMLRSMSESVGTKLNEVDTFVKEDRFPMDDLQRYIRDQLQHLRSEVLKYDEAIAQYHQTEHANELLVKQAESQKELCARLEEQIRCHCQTETDLKSRYAQLEKEVVDLRDMAHDHNSDPPELEQELVNLRHQMRKAEENLQAKATELDDANRRLQEQGNEMAKEKQFAAEQKAVIIEQIKQIQQAQRQHQKYKVQDTSAEVIRIEETHRRALKEKEVSLGNEIHRLRAERDEHKDSALSLNQEAKVARKKLEAAEEELKRLQQSVGEGSSLAQELAHVKQQFAQEADSLRLKQRDLDDITKEQTKLRAEIATHQEKGTQLKSELAEKLNMVTSLQRKLDDLAETHGNDATTLQEMRSQMESLRREKRDLELNIEQFHNKESKFNDVQTKFSIDRERLQTEAMELRTELEKKEHELQRRRTDTSEQLKKIEETHDTEVNELKRRLTLAESAVKEADAKVLRVEDEKTRQFEDHQRSIDKKVESLVREKLAAKEREQQRKGALHQFASQVEAAQHSSKAVSTHLPASPGAHTGSMRKKVTRQNISTLSVVGPSRAHSTSTPAGPNSSQAHLDERGVTPEGDDVAVDSSLLEDLGAWERLDENGVSVVGAAEDANPNTQGSLTVAFSAFNMELQNLSPTKDRTSSSLSDAPSSSEMLFQEESDSLSERGMRQQPREHHPMEEVSQHLRTIETPYQASNHPEMDSRVHWSQGRPISQANTASKMAPPPPPSFGQKGSFREEASRLLKRRSITPQHGDTDTNSSASSPDYVHRSPSGHKTYGHKSGPLATAHRSQRSTTRQVQHQELSRKRKGSDNEADHWSSSKRHQSSSQSLPVGATPKVYQRNAAVPSGSTNRRRSRDRSQGTGQSSQDCILPRSRSGRAGSVRHSPAAPKRAQGADKRGRDIERFNRELQPEGYGSRRRRLR
ncbi:hypothetical protein K458DRAFT_88845 [Lentithecium fluviatile CBS 122367]|uniref:Uncharacterized protein n=1 Tax=Lentithecium fluviatile CBS 122367 TaxID=1168545 RepID=A0A6G1IRZ3_9PLEO|nr:hypothetical protein K458DRAFT_88845 [Lentithecium fluviatile CBS 122367]